MRSRKHIFGYRFHRGLEFFVACLAIVLVLLMFIPLHTALSAGIAALSLVIFFLCLMIIAFMLHGKHLRKHPLLLIGFAAALLGMLVPQLAYFATAQQHGATLRFDPLSYLHFSGQTDLKPAKIVRFSEHGTFAYYPASTAGVHPVVVLVHGGGWRYGNFLETGAWPSLLTNSGYTVVSVEYRLSSDTSQSWQTAPSDIHEAILLSLIHI